MSVLFKTYSPLKTAEVLSPGGKKIYGGRQFFAAFGHRFKPLSRRKTCGSPFRKFENGVRSSGCRGHAPGGNAPLHGRNSAVFSQHDGVDRKSHKKHVDGSAGDKQKPSSLRKLFTELKTGEPGKKPVRDLDLSCGGTAAFFHNQFQTNSCVRLCLPAGTAFRSRLAYIPGLELPIRV